MVSLASLKRLDASTLSALLLCEAADGEPSIAVVDVRDEDHIGGHIRGSHHVPSSTLDYAIPSLVRKLASKDIVVFHCALSQQRGPSAALRYLRERERLLGLKGGETVSEAMKKSAAESRAATQDGADADWEDVDAAAADKPGKEQSVYVLDKGFRGWQEVYGEDQRLTENYSKELWQDY